MKLGVKVWFPVRRCHMRHKTVPLPAAITPEISKDIHHLINVSD